MRFFVDFSNRPQKLGSFLTLKSEFQLLSSLAKERKNTLYFVPGALAELNNEFCSILKDDEVEMEIVVVSSEDLPVKKYYPENILEELNDNTYFSTARLRFLYALFGIKPSIAWGRSTSNIMSDFRTYLSDRFLMFVIGQPYINQNADIFYESWVDFLTNLRKFTNLPFFIAGNDYRPEEISRISSTFILSSLGCSISQQAYLISKSTFFVGTASGLCAPAMLSRVPYVILKHPSYHSDEMKKELVNSRLPWASQNQIFDISEISSFVLNSKIKELLYHAAK